MAKKIGIDLGSSKIRISTNKDGIIVDDNSTVAIEVDNKTIIKAGSDAEAMIGRTPGKMKAVKPIKNGVIDDFELTEGLISHLLQKSSFHIGLTKPIIVFTYPSGVTEVDKNALKELGEELGAKEVVLKEKSLISAYGLDMNLEEPVANMIVDIGFGLTEIAIISLNDIVISSSIKTAGRNFNEDIKKYIKMKYKLLIGEKTAENIKRTIGCIHKTKEDETMEIKGRNLISGLPNSANISSKEVKEAIKDSVDQIVKQIKNILEKTPPELSADIVDKGMVLTGGSSELKGLLELLEEKLQIPVIKADNNKTTIADGFIKYFSTRNL